jgi:hypothetical protein
MMTLGGYNRAEFSHCRESVIVGIRDVEIGRLMCAVVQAV